MKTSTIIKSIIIVLLVANLIIGAQIIERLSSVPTLEEIDERIMHWGQHFGQHFSN